MLDDIIELIFEIILEGMLDAAGSKKVPMPVRIALGAVLGLLLVGIFGLLLFVGIRSGSAILIVIAIILLIGAAIGVTLKVKGIRKRR